MERTPYHQNGRPEGTRIVPAPLCCANWPPPAKLIKPACRLPRSIVSGAPAVSPNANCCSIKPPRTKSTKPSLPVRSGSPTCCLAPGSDGRVGASSRSSSRPLSTMPAASSRTPSSIPTRDWTPFSTASAKLSPPAASPPACIWTTQNLPFPAVGPHRRRYRYSHRAYPSLSARRPRQDRTLLPFCCGRPQKNGYVVIAVIR